MLHDVTKKETLFESLAYNVDFILRRNSHTEGTVSRFCRYAALASLEVTSCGTFSGLDPGWNSAAWKARIQTPRGQNLLRELTMLEIFKECFLAVTSLHCVFLEVVWSFYCVNTQLIIFWPV